MIFMQQQKIECQSIQGLLFYHLLHEKTLSNFFNNTCQSQRLILIYLLINKYIFMCNNSLIEINQLLIPLVQFINLFTSEIAWQHCDVIEDDVSNNGMSKKCTSEDVTSKNSRLFGEWVQMQINYFYSIVYSSMLTFMY